MSKTKELNQYIVCFATAETYIDVEAENEEQAIELAEAEVYKKNTDLCGHCSDKMTSCDPYVTSVNKD
jgi:hypothetical protein